MFKPITIYKYEIDGNYICSYASIAEAARQMSVNESSIRKAVKHPAKTCCDYRWSNIKVPNIMEGYSDSVRMNTRLAKDVLKEKDLNRIERKSFREYSRVENAIVEYNKELIKLLEKESLGVHVVYHKESLGKAKIILQISDLHLNELVDLPNNHFDFIVASKRLQKLADFTKKVCKMFNVSKVIIAMTGDMLNSDRRIDELLSMSVNRAKASLIAVKLLSYLLLDLNNSGYNLAVTCVTGNESRIQPEWGWGDFILSDNYDMAIFNMLQILMENKAGIEFISNEDPFEMVLHVNGLNILTTHGTSTGRDTQASIQQIIGKYASKGVLIDYVLFGHLHFANITDAYSRSGSLVGNNIYSDRALNLITKPSQIIHIVDSEKNIHNMRVELSDVSGYRGYPIQDDLDAYNARATSKIHGETTIIKIVT